MRLDIKSKADVRFFIYYLLNGTLDFDLLSNQLSTSYIDYFEHHPELFFETCCIFINHKKRTPDINPMNRRAAEYICKTIEPNNFQEFAIFEPWELDFTHSGTDFFNCFKDFAFKVAFDKIERLQTIPYYKHLFSYGATFSETVFVIWANNLEFENETITNQQFAVDRAAQWFIDNEAVEEWEFELEM